MRTRMVPFDRLVPRLRRIVRQISGELGKQLSLSSATPMARWTVPSSNVSSRRWSTCCATPSTTVLKPLMCGVLPVSPGHHSPGARP